MESQPQNPEFRNNPENLHSYIKNLKYLLFCNIGGTLANICGNMVFPPKEHASLSRALSATTALLKTGKKTLTI